jgi:hypothetical protein
MKQANGEDEAWWVRWMSSMAVPWDRAGRTPAAAAIFLGSWLPWNWWLGRQRLLSGSPRLVGGGSGSGCNLAESLAILYSLPLASWASGFN